MKKYFVFLVASIFLFTFCSTNKEEEMKKFIDRTTVQKTIKALIEKYGENERPRVEKSINQMANFWTEEDGSKKDFSNSA
jgi:hypothetical protein